jgi:hypothetical protein
LTPTLEDGLHYPDSERAGALNDSMEAEAIHKAGRFITGAIIRNSGANESLDTRAQIFGGWNWVSVGAVVRLKLDD